MQLRAKVIGAAGIAVLVAAGGSAFTAGITRAGPTPIISLAPLGP